MTQQQNKNQKYTFHVDGMHCNACVLMIESELGELPEVTSVKSVLKNHSLEIEGDFGSKTREQIAEELTLPLKSVGYTVSVEKHVPQKKWADFKFAIPFALGFAILFIVLQKMGLVNFLNAGEVTYGTAFVIGIVASLSSCMAVVGGLLLSMSATFAKEGDKIKPQLMFHGGRIISFFVLGGVIGLMGTAFTLNTVTTFILSFVVGVAMLILGINLLDIFHVTKKFQIGMPKFIAKRAHGVAKLNHTLTPFLVGIATFFLPCGFTQSMQMYTPHNRKLYEGRAYHARLCSGDITRAYPH
ncbi:hypothetical protein AUJ77_03010 [Candidatus Nomurabacteria bacterium CG1_02_43_90]|uniref:HMA domain-containing protein n=1 Tax=Candidatus Nomurabacteria bacterium CG1_02_43_90 TaxID=1805281 RepID=A0A1J4V8B9_9BACT|nr:MAG: hypothetical protein AUJ77_03010 [Candidatus Nomurabacteria bacterium CG1_02_43_90]